MIIMTYNLFEGAAATRTALTDLVAAVGPDVVCLQEANGWDLDDEASARRFARQTGLHHWILGRGGSPFLVGVFSRTPFLRTRIHTQGLWHCAVQVTVHDGPRELDIWNLHLNPFGEDERLTEVRTLLDRIDVAGDGLVVGDLNSLSAVDEYPPDLADALAASGIAKFGTGTVRREVLPLLSESGLTDVAAARGTARWTVPTPASADPNHATRLRLDYVLATSSTLPRVASVTTMTEGLADVVSDHYPLIAMIEE